MDGSISCLRIGLLQHYLLTPFLCSLLCSLLSVQVNFPLCTIAHMPRLPEHCVEYVKVLQWPKEQPFGEDVAIDGDDPAHVQWIYEKSLERAQQYNISNVTYRLTQGLRLD